MIINQEYKVWKKDSAHQYDFLIQHSLDWPSYTFQWLPETDASEDYANHYAIISSNAAEADQCQLQKIRVQMPNEGKGKPLTYPGEKYMELKEHKISIVEKIQHSGEINRARYCPANPKITAVATNKGDINLMTMKENVGRLVAHTSEGYGLAWNTVNPNLLASGNTDKRICLWDIEKNKQENGRISPTF